MPLPDDRARVGHMRDASLDALDFVRGRSESELETDRMFLFAVVRAIEIVGEAAARVTPETQRRFPEVPWSQIIGMRHRLAHGYYDVRLDLLWSTVTLNFPHLLEALEPVIKTMEA